MRQKESKVIVVFHTTTEAIAMETACQNGGITGRLIPVPRQISSGCGLAFCAPAQKEEEILEFMHRVGLRYEAAGIYLI